MDALTDTTAMKSNSTVASIKLGYRLFAGNFKKLFKASWLFALLFGLVWGGIGPILSIKLPALITQAMTNPETAMSLSQQYVGLLSICFILFIVGGVVEMMFYSSGFSLLRNHLANDTIPRSKTWFSFDRKIVLRTIKGILASLFVLFVTFMLLGLLYYIGVKTLFIRPDVHTGFAVWVILSIAIFLFVCIPMLFIPIKYILDDKTRFWKLFASDYKIGLRHFGFIFIISLFMCVVMVVATFILQLPTVLLTTANYQANLGMFYGDTLGMPEYIVPLTALVFFISGFMQAYIRISTLFPLYYMYGSIETQEKERKKYQLSMNNK